MTDSIQSRYERLKALDEARTQGEWCFSEVRWLNNTPTHWAAGPTTCYSLEDAQFIAAVPDAMSLLHDLMAERERLLTALEQINRAEGGGG